MLNIWKLGQVRDTKFGTVFSNKNLFSAAECQDYSFYRFRVIKGKSLEGRGERGWGRGGGGGGGGGDYPQARFAEVAVIYFTKIFFTFFYFSQTLDWKFFGLTYILE